MRLEKRNYKTVSGSTADISVEYIIPNGKKFYMSEVGGDAVNDPDVRAMVIWDPIGLNQIVFSTILSNVQKVFQEFVGDGVKKLQIKLDNQNLTSKTMGAYFLGDEA